MSLCSRCGQATIDGGLCTYPGSQHDDWAIGNRIMCDFIHRGVLLGAPAEPLGPLSGVLEAPAPFY
jgi:hypothetical protein